MEIVVQGGYSNGGKPWVLIKFTMSQQADMGFKITNKVLIFYLDGVRVEQR